MERALEIDGKKIIYRALGEGKPVVLLHGFGETSEVWRTITPHLQHCRLIIPDLPGSGGSAPTNDLSMEGMATVVYRIMQEELGNGKAIIIGHSMGGYITLALAESHPEIFGALGLFHSTAYADSEEKKATRRKAIEFIRKNGAGEFLKTSIPNLFSPASKAGIPGIIGELIDAGNNFSPEALVSYYEGMISRPDRSNLLKTMKIPFLFIFGKFDSAVPLQDGLSLCHLPDKSYIHILHQSGHMGMLEEADRSIRILNEFISEI